MYFNQLISMTTKWKLHGILLREEEKQNVTLHQAFCTWKNNFVINPNQAADAFNYYFLELVEKLKLQDSQVDSAISYLVSHTSNHYPITMVDPVKRAELIGTIGSLKNKNSSGYDGIPNKILILCSHLTSKPLSYIFNIRLFWLFFLINSNMQPCWMT